MNIGKVESSDWKASLGFKNYLVESEGISSERITTNCEVGGGDANTVDIRGNQ